MPKSTITGTEDSDVIFGDAHGTKAGPDVIFGLGGNDALYGLNGSDELHGGDGNDQLVGGAGGDDLFGDAGSDQLWGEIGNDLLDGGAGNDTLTGGDGSDRIIGGTDDGSFTFVAGQEPAWTFFGGDMLYGNDGNDTFVYDGLGAGVDQINDFQLGRDTIEIAGFDAAHTVILDGADHDVVAFLDGSGNVIDNAAILTLNVNDLTLSDLHFV